METTEGPSDGGEGYGHSGGGPHRVPAARDPPGATGGGAAEMETTETTGGLARRDNRPAWVAAGKVGAKMGGAASAPATLLAQGTRAAAEPGSGAAASAGGTPRQQFGAVWKWGRWKTIKDDTRQRRRRQQRQQRRQGRELRQSQAVRQQHRRGRKKGWARHLNSRRGRRRARRRRRGPAEAPKEPRPRRASSGSAFL